MDFSLKLTAFEDPPPTLCSCLAASTLVIWNKGWYFKMLWLACTTLLSIFCTNVAATYIWLLSRGLSGIQSQKDPALGYEVKLEE